MTFKLAMHVLMISLALALTACAGGKTEVIERVIETDGHAVLTVKSEAAECPYGGERIDLYMDLDDDGVVGDKDQSLGSVTACNGAPGEDGEDGEDGKKCGLGWRNGNGNKH